MLLYLTILLGVVQSVHRPAVHIHKHTNTTHTQNHLVSQSQENMQQVDDHSAYTHAQTNDTVR
jgi:hypothetical protein